MKRFLACAAVSVVIFAQGVVAADIAPADVKFEDIAVATPLTEVVGNADEGAKIVVDRGLGNCLACHAITPLAKEQFHGSVGPSLDGVADRRSPTELRAIVVNAKQVFSEETVMPAFYSLDVGVHPRKDLEGKAILSAQQVEDVVAYLGTLKEED